MFAGVWSDTGGARAILKLGEVGLVRPHVCPQVLLEIDNNLRRKAPELLGEMAILLDRVGLIEVGPVPESLYQEALALTGHPGDARVLADAWKSGIDFFVTLDRQHFLKSDTLDKTLPFPLGTPGEFLLWYRKIYIE